MADNTTNNCRQAFDMTAKFDCNNPGNIKYEMTDNHFFVNIDGQFYAVGEITLDGGNPGTLAQPVNLFEAFIGHCREKPVYETLEDLNQAITDNPDNPAYANASQVLNHLLPDADPSTPTIELGVRP